MRFTQTNRQIAISTPLGEDVLLLRAFNGFEAISRLFSFEVELLSEDDSISFDDLVGQRVDLRIELADSSSRFFDGFVSRFSQAGRDQNLVVYHATVVPWLWFLTRTADCRIFQHKKAPDIIRQIFTDLGFSDFSLQLHGDFVERDYCVQYRETDFNFVSRLMEEEGIFYFFEHEEGKHTLVLANDPNAHKACPNQPTARYELSAGGWQEDDVVLEWRQEQEFRPGAYAVTDYNFETPASSLYSTVNGNGKYEIYDFPGEYRRRAEGDGLVRIRLEEQETPRVVARAASDCRAFTTGYRFDLLNHYRSDLNQAYVLTALHHSGSQGVDFLSGSPGLGGDMELTYRNSFECIPHKTPFRPPRLTPTPIVQGCQSAVVVGPAGEEIFTDKYSRVKVQFHWDREGKRNENSSCWIRVSHPWAGKGWGSISIPRIGQEVLVDFLEGDPDQPIITGRVYNAGQMPPFDLPGKAVISGVKSNSTKGGGGNNEFSLDDTKGNELINVHGQYDMQTRIEHDERVTIVNDRTENVGRNEKITIGNNRTENVGVNETIGIGSTRTETVGKHEVVSVGLTRTHNVGVNDMLNVGAANEVTVGGFQAITVGGVRAVTVGASQRISVGQNETQAIGHNLTVTAGDTIVLKTGAASISMQKDGTIVIEGKDITIKGSGDIVTKAASNIVMKATKIAEN